MWCVVSFMDAGDGPMPQADRMRSHAQHFREMALLAEYPLTISHLLDEADAFDRVAMELERQDSKPH
jgi:hypothetical protein